MMEAGIGLDKVDALRALLERGGESLTTSTHLADFIPKIAAREKERVADEIKDELGCLIYDGTTRLGEALACLWRQCSKNFIIMQRLVAFRTTATHMNGQALYRLLGTILLRDLAKQPEEVIADARDSCSTNGVAERMLAILCPAMALNKCISHVLVGYIYIPTPAATLRLLYIYISHYIYIFSSYVCVYVYPTPPYVGGVAAAWAARSGQSMAAPLSPYIYIWHTHTHNIYIYIYIYIYT